MKTTKYIVATVLFFASSHIFAESRYFRLISPRQNSVFKSKTLMLRGKTLRNQVWLRITINNETNTKSFFVENKGTVIKTIHLIPGITNVLKIEAGINSNQLNVAEQRSVISDLELSTGGWIFMISAWLLIILLNVFAFIHIFRIKEEKIVEPLEIETKD